MYVYVNFPYHIYVLGGNAHWPTQYYSKYAQKPPVVAEVLGIRYSVELLTTGPGYSVLSYKFD